jgi:cysteine-rich repeat protein
MKRALVCVSLGLVAAGCGAVCGNGKVEDGEQCDDGNTADGDGCSSTCRYVPTIDTYVAWSLIGDEWPGHPETCGDVGADEVLVELVGPRPFSQRIQCGFYQYKLSALPPGDYVAKGTLYAGTTALTRTATRAFVAAGAQQTVTVDFAYEDFLPSYVGTFYLQVKWDGADTCAAAGVVSQRLRLTRDGATIGTATELGDALDGSPSPCRDAAAPRAQVATGLTWGPALLEVSGLDDEGVERFHGAASVFIGADISNAPWVVDVPGVGADAGAVDAADHD